MHQELTFAIRASQGPSERRSDGGGFFPSCTSGGALQGRRDGSQAADSRRRSCTGKSIPIAGRTRPFVSHSKPLRWSRRSGPGPVRPPGGLGGLVDLYFVYLSFVCLYFVILYLVVCDFPFAENPFAENPFAVNPFAVNPLAGNPSAENPSAASRPLRGCLYAVAGEGRGFWGEFAPICPQIARRRL